jgi:hypothetical protein
MMQKRETRPASARDDRNIRLLGLAVASVAQVTIYRPGTDAA